MEEQVGNNFVLCTTMAGIVEKKPILRANGSIGVAEILRHEIINYRAINITVPDFINGIEAAVAQINAATTSINTNTANLAASLAPPTPAPAPAPAPASGT